ncbi:hypothetical protein GCM10022247_18050 [Allokutzneria multivorans]|uniref:Uncharacterized protein n=1 Tax=Allokutzneria multivorans TaxID=1142134 RepID=A0ABP7RJ76_9PSEU
MHAVLPAVEVVDELEVPPEHAFELVLVHPRRFVEGGHEREKTPSGELFREFTGVREQVRVVQSSGFRLADDRVVPMRERTALERRAGAEAAELRAVQEPLQLAADLDVGIGCTIGHEPSQTPSWLVKAQV